jgi:uncharacterized protein
MEAARLATLPRRHIAGHEVPVAIGLRARLLGLVGLPREQAGAGLLIPNCTSIHTFGMRFAIDVVFLDGEDRPLALYRGVASRRLLSFRAARSVLEVPSPQGGEIVRSAT